MIKLAYQAGMIAALEKLGIDLAGAKAAYERLKDVLVKRPMYSTEAGLGTLEKFPKAKYVGPITSHETKKIYARGDVAHLMAKNLTDPKDQELFNRLMVLHEASERSSIMNRHGIKNWRAGHHDPTVLLHENNMLATLPAEHGEVKERFKYLRGDEMEKTLPLIEEFLPAPFGERRYNRHEIKEIARQIREKYPSLLRSTKKE